MKNYDLNIWDELEYETDGEQTGGWKINAYEITAWGSVYTTGQPLPNEYKLKPWHLKMMGIKEETWIDAHSLLADHLVPRSVVRWLKSLPQT